MSKEEDVRNTFTQISVTCRSNDELCSGQPNQIVEQQVAKSKLWGYLKVYFLSDKRRRMQKSPSFGILIKEI